MFNDNENKFIALLEKTKRYVKGELKLDNCDGKWFAMDYREEFAEACSIYNNPLITDKEAKEQDIDIIKCCDECNISYVE